jgi:hypothetical protein
MDHLTHLANGIKKPIHLPRVYNKRVDYDELGLPGFPERHLGSRIHIESYQDIADYADFHQAWLFFGLIHEFCSIFDVSVDLSDFVRKNESSQETITTEKLPLYIWYCAANASGEAFSNGPSVSIDTERTRLRTAKVHNLLNVIHMIINSLWDADAAESSPGHLVMIPITIMFEALYMATHCLLLPATGQSYESPLPPKALRKLSVECGWCPGQVAFFSKKLDSAASLYLLASTRKRPDGKNHFNCTNEECNAFQLDEATYRTKHVQPLH